MEHDFSKSMGLDLEHLASQLDRSMTKLDQTEQRFAERRIIPGETAFRDPKDAYHQITLGAVLTARGLSAHEARALDGILSLTFEEVLPLIQQMVDAGPSDDDESDNEETIGDALLEMLRYQAGELEDRGRYAEWRRSFDRYQATTEKFLRELGEDELGKLSQRPPSRKQLYLIRTTCAYLQLESPTLNSRAEAFHWLRETGANARFREQRS